MASAFSGGAAHCYVGLGGAIGEGTPVYFGTGRGRPKIRRNRKWIPLPNDMAGDEPYDWSYMGQSALVAYQMTRWEEPVYQALAQAADPIAGYQGARQDGIDYLGDLGTLMLTEDKAFDLWIAQPYGAKPSYGDQGARHHKGWHFYAAIFMGPDDLERGTAPAEDHVVFYCTRKFHVPSNNFILYDHSMLGLHEIGGIIAAPY